MGDRGPSPWVSCPIYTSPSIINRTNNFSIVSAPIIQVYSTPGIRFQNATQTSYRTSSGSESRILQPPICGSQGKWRLASCHRSQFPESLGHENKIQNGNTQYCASSTSQERLDVLHRSSGRILSGTYTSGFSSIPQICLARTRISIQSPMFRPDHGPTSVYTGDGAGSSTGSLCRNPAAQVPGRLADRCLGSSTTNPRQTVASIPLSTTRTSHQYGEVRSHSFPDSYIPGHVYRYGSRSGLPIEKQNSKVPATCSTFSGTTYSTSMGMATSSRAHDLTREASSHGPFTHEIFTIPTETTLESKPRFAVHQSTINSRYPFRYHMVGRSRSLTDRSAIDTKSSRYAPFHRCFIERVGCTFGRPAGSRIMDTIRERPTHQYARTKSSLARLESLPGLCAGKNSSFNVRQLYSSLAHSSSGRYKILVPMSTNITTASMGPQSTDKSPGSVFTWTAQCLGRPTKQTQTSPSIGMVTTSGDLSKTLVPLGPTSHRYVCYRPQSQTPSVCLPSPRPTSLGNRCHGSTMGQHGDVHVSSNQSPQIGNQQDHTQSKPACSPDCTNVATTGVVSRPTGSSGRSTSNTPVVAKPPKTTTSRQVPSKHRDVEPTRVEALQSILRKRGFSRKVASRISRPHRASTLNLYQAKWSIFCGWCRKRSINPIKASLPNIADFLLYLRDKKHLSVPAVKGYRSALAQVFTYKSIDISNSKEISSLIKNFEQELPPKKVSAPQWDLNLVLQSLRSAPYEPIKLCSLKHLTLKTVFLPSLATAKRVSELHGLSHIVQHSHHWSSVTLQFAPDFVAKTQITGRPETNYGTINIPSMSQILDHHDDELVLCPVRSLREYLRRTEESRPTCARLFISTNTKKPRPITKNTISFWLRQVILFAYKNANPDALTLVKVKAHEVRALATSLAFSKNMSLSEVMHAASWRSNTTFVSHYLRDCTHTYLDTNKLGPVVAAQKIIGCRKNKP